MYYCIHDDYCELIHFSGAVSHDVVIYVLKRLMSLIENKNISEIREEIKIRI